ncbi:MFS transporter [Chloroflexota bacterium]
MIKKVFPILALSIFSSLLGGGIVLPLLPLYAESMGASGIWIGLIFAAFPISNIIATPVFSRLSDRGGRKPFLAIGLFSYAVISFGFIWANTIFQLVGIRFLQGITGGMILPIAQAYIGDISPEGEEGKWMGYANAAFFSGFGFGPLMGGLLAEHMGMATAFLAMGSLNLLAFFIVLFFLPGAIHKRLMADPSVSFWKISTNRTINGLFSYRIAFALGRGILMTFLPIFVAVFMALSPALIGILLAVSILLQSLLGVPLGRLADRFSRRALVVIGSVVSFVYLALIPWTHSFWQVLGLAVFGSVGGALSLTAASAMVVEEGRKFGMGSAIAVFHMAFSIGLAIGPILSGAIADLVGISAVFYFGAAILFIGTYLFIWFTR